MALEDLIGYQSQNRSLIEIWEGEIEGSGDKPGCEPPTKVCIITGSRPEVLTKNLGSSLGSRISWSDLNYLNSIGKSLLNSMSSQFILC